MRHAKQAGTRTKWTQEIRNPSGDRHRHTFSYGFRPRCRARSGPNHIRFGLRGSRPAPLYQSATSSADHVPAWLNRPKNRSMRPPNCRILPVRSWRSGSQTIRKRWRRVLRGSRPIRKSRRPAPARSPCERAWPESTGRKSLISVGQINWPGRPCEASPVQPCC